MWLMNGDDDYDVTGCTKNAFIDVRCCLLPEKRYADDGRNQFLRRELRRNSAAFL